MNELVAAERGLALPELQRCMQKSRAGKIKTAAKSKNRLAVRLTVFVLLGLTLCGFATFDYKNIDLLAAIAGTLDNARVLFGQPRLMYTNGAEAWTALLVSFSLGALSTIFGALLGLLGALFCAGNIANPIAAGIIKRFVSLIRAVPTILWVLIFTVAAGLGSVAAVVGLTFHSAGYLTKAYAESIEEMDSGVIEALKASGASFWQIVFQAILPSSISYMVAWTFLRFEINFINAIAVGAAAGAGGIGFELYMAGSHYFDLRELGWITYMVVAAVIALELLATKIKAKVG
ncbi:MAG: ABC transporter permease subunit [Clostridiales Family XIII bacterium]|jgi:phosphonate transport system permease protein|nr:ABC transporter permease subunit [Clostridiales Family XIII bacterium]